MSRILCFGELLLRMVPDMPQSWIRESGMQCYVGGSELNVAMALARWGHQTGYLTALPSNAIGDDLANYLQAQGIDISNITRREGRIGIYYLPGGADLKHTSVIYDRADSVFARLKPGDIDWDRVLEDVSWLHLSGIVPALNPTLAGICTEAVRVARSREITISVDLNYRSRLWQYTHTPASYMKEIAKGCQVIMGNIWATEQLLEVPVDSGAVQERKYTEAADTSAASIFRDFPGCTHVAFTFRLEDLDNTISYQGYLNTRNSGRHHSPVYKIGRISDRVGSGDCFMAGLINGLLCGYGTHRTVESCTAAAVAKLGEHGDFTRRSLADIDRFIQSHYILSSGIYIAQNNIQI